MKKLSCIAALLATSAAGFAAPIEFEDTSDKLGFERGTESWGISWGNLNRDIYPDLFNQGHRDYTRLYRNTGRADFEDVSYEYDVQMGMWWLSNTQRDVHGAAWGDFDNDGDDDLIVGDEDEFFINNAESTGYLTQLFLTSEQAYASWIPSTTSATLISETNCNGNYTQFLDLDGNGTLDKICADADDFPEAGSSDEAENLIPGIGNVSDSIVGDFNNDLISDIVVLRGALRPHGADLVDPNSLDIWFRDGTGASVTFVATGDIDILVDGDGGSTFTQPDLVEHDSNASFSTRVRDIDISFDSGTGVYTVDDDSNSQHYLRVRAAAPITDVQVMGLSNRDLPSPVTFGTGSPTGITWGTAPGLGAPVSCTSVTAADFDNDMDLDLYMVCRDGIRNSANRYYDNQGNGTFSQVLAHGAEGPMGVGDEFGVSESVALADYDVDGFMDLAVVNGLLFYPYGVGGPDSLFRNKGNGNHWIEIDLIGTTTNRNGMGAKVYVTAGGVTQLREQNGGYHRWSQDHQRIHFGLAGNTTVSEVRIEWPSGQVDTFSGIGSDRLYKATEGGAFVAAVAGPEVLTRIEPGEECGMPDYTISYGPAMLLWRDCGTNNWRLRMRSGLGRLVDEVPQVVTGSVTGDNSFNGTNGNNLEPADTFTLANSMQIDFDIEVRDDGPAANKTMFFNTGNQTSTCLSFSRQDMEAIIIGSSGKRLDPPFDLSNGLQPCDSDGDGLSNEVDPDDDNDGFNDDVDAFPLHPGEWQDTDGDGVGDNSDAFPNNPNEQSDADNDGIGDNADIDADNDGLPDMTEFVDAGFTRTLSPFQVAANGGSTTQNVDLSAEGVSIGSSVLVSGLLADGDINGSTEFFSLNFNGGEFLTGNLQTEQQCVGALYPTSTPLTEIVTVIDIGGGVPGISILGSTTPDVGNLNACNGIGLQYQLTVSGVPQFSMDEDNDWALNFMDLDSDNDTIPDVVEAGLPDTDGDFIVDNLVAGQGTVNVAPDTDGDGLPDFLDLESGNPANDGTAYDIAGSAFAAFDTNGDGRLSSADNGGGIDLDMDGIDDLIDRNNGVPGSPGGGGGNNPPTANGQSVPTPFNTPVNIVLTGNDPDMDALNFAITSQPSSGTLSGTAPNVTYTPNAGFVGADSFTFTVNDGQATSGAATVTINVQAGGGGPEITPLTSWVVTTGGVSTAGNQVSYSGSPVGWSSNTANSAALETLGFNDDYTVRFTLDSDPSTPNTRAIFGLGVDETSANWRDVDYGFRIDNGNLSIRENGIWRAGGGALQLGDVLEIDVDSGTIEYRLNDALLFTSTYSGQPAFYVDSSFNAIALSFSVDIVGVGDVVNPPTTTSITSWSGATGGVTATGNALSYSGSPAGWNNNTINSATLSSLGATGDFDVNFEVASDPAGTTWIVGLGVNESQANWRDVDFGLRSSNGNLTVYENGTRRTAVGPLAQGSVLTIGKKGSAVQYRLDGVLIFESQFTGTPDFYIDTSFKSGAIDLQSFELLTP